MTDIVKALEDLRDEFKNMPGGETLSAYAFQDAARAVARRLDAIIRNAREERPVLCTCLPSNGKLLDNPLCAFHHPAQREETKAGPAIMEALLDQFILMELGQSAHGEQLYNGRWYCPRWGVDTLDHIADAIAPLASKAEPGLREIVENMLEWHTRGLGPDDEMEPCDKAANDWLIAHPSEAPAPSEETKAGPVIAHTVGENDALFRRYGIRGREHTPETDQLCEIIRKLEAPAPSAGEPPTYSDGLLEGYQAGRAENDPARKGELRERVACELLNISDPYVEWDGRPVDEKERWLLDADRILALLPTAGGLREKVEVIATKLESVHLNGLMSARTIEELTDVTRELRAALKEAENA